MTENKRHAGISKEGVAVAAVAGVGIVAMSAFLFREKLFGFNRNDEEQKRMPPNSIKKGNPARPREANRSMSSYERAKDFINNMFMATKSSAQRASLLKGVMFVGV